MKITKSLLAVSALCLAMLLTSSFAYAHQVKAALTRIEFNPRSNMLEIMHRFDLHDAEHAVQELFSGSADIIKDEKTQERFAQYVLERFGMYYPDDSKLELNFVGYEVEGKHFWVYQETPKPEKLEGIQVVHNALRDIWLAQSNLVNVKIDQNIESLTFTDNTEVLNIDFVK